MHFGITTLFLFGISQGTALALPADTPRILKRWETPDGTFTAYARDDDLKTVDRDLEGNHLVRRCASSRPECHGSHQGPSRLCGALTTGLGLWYSDVDVGESPRAICFEASEQHSGKCCVSWSSVVSNAHVGDLFGAALNVYGTCATGDQMSGLVRDVQVGGSCTTVCLSGRPNGCS